MLAGCSAPAPPPPEPEPEYWTISRTVDTASGEITLFDPAALAHHRSDPPNWYHHDFAFASDLATGRFAAVSTGRTGALDVRVTEAPPSPREAAAAGPSAVQRLRVTDQRLLLAGGDAWPSIERPTPPGPFDPRWLGVEDGDYRVTITVLDDVDDTLHDVVFRLEPVESMTSVPYAPGIPHLTVGGEAAVVGLGASGRRFVERCGEVPGEGLWAPPADGAGPLPGEWSEFGVPEPLHDRGFRLQETMLEADLPLVTVDRAEVGELGAFVRPTRWLEPRTVDGWRDVHEARGRASCLVRVTGVAVEGGRTRLSIEPVPLDDAPLPATLRRDLVEVFQMSVRVAGHPGWRYRSARIGRAPDDLSLVLGIVRELGLRGAEREALLLAPSEERAQRLLERLASIRL